VDPTRADQQSFAKHFAHAQGWLLLDKFAAARRSLAKIPAGFRRRPEVLGLRAQIHLAAQEWAKAAPLLRRVVKLAPGNPENWVSLAYAVRRAESIEAAEAILQHARACFPEVAVIWFNLACYAAQQGRWVDVDRLLPEAVRLEPAFADAAKIDPDLAPYWQHRKFRDAPG
jgi:predicted Zn-dependent protease